MNDKRRKCVNEHDLSNLDKISTGMPLKYNTSKPYTQDAFELYVNALRDDVQSMCRRQINVFVVFIDPL